jgi:hypothetical protein
VVFEIIKYAWNIQNIPLCEVLCLGMAAAVGTSLHTKRASTGNLDCVFACSLVCLTS